MGAGEGTGDGSGGLKFGKKKDLPTMTEAELVAKEMKRYKKRAKKACLCGTLWLLLGLILVIVGIVLLVYFAQYWNDETTYKQSLAHTGVGLLLIGLAMFGVAIVIFIILYCMYKAFNRKEKKSGAPEFKPPTFAPGEAPYPQQPMSNLGPSPSPNPGQSPTHQPLMVPNPSAPPKPLDSMDVHVEVTPHTKF